MKSVILVIDIFKRIRFFIFLIIVWFCATPSSFSQINASQEKKGFGFGILPVLGYNNDIGFKYGIQGAIFDYGKSSIYPDYRKMLKLEISRSTKGSGINQLFFDSEHLFGKSNIRLTADLSYLTERTCDFFGFNGAESNYNAGFVDEGDSSYISRYFYSMDRTIFRVTCDLNGPIVDHRFRWLFGLGYFNYTIASVDTARFNKNQPDNEKLPDTALLYDNYVSWGLIPSNDANGGNHTIFKAGVIYDTRDVEPNPSRGIWSEVIVVVAPKFLWNDENSFTRLAVTHRQYFSLVKDRLTFVYRLSYQGTIIGKVPFYSMPYFYSSFLNTTLEEGLGGAKTIRGMLRDRVIGEGVIYGNFEFRYKFLRMVLWKQNLYFALNPFLDAGRVVQKVQVDESGIPPDVNLSNYFTGNNEGMHYTTGCGLHIGWNENFVAAFDFGYAFSRQDGKLGIYLGMNWLF